MAQDDDRALNAELDALTPDADEDTRADLVERLAPTIARNLLDYPWLSDPAGRLSKGEQVTAQMFIEAVVELYDPAQLDVLGRASALAHEQARAARE